MFTRTNNDNIKIILICLTILFLLLQGYSENSRITEPAAEGALEGVWVTNRIVNEDFLSIFEYEKDDYLDSQFIRFAADKFQRYYNRDGSAYDVYTWQLDYGENSYTITSTESSEFNYHFKGDTLVTVYTTPFGNAESAYYSYYPGKLPPDSWTH